MKPSFVLGLLLLLIAAGCARHHTQAPAPAPAPTTDSRYPYRKPLTSLGAKFGALPPVVQNTVRAEAGMAEMTEVSKSATADRVYYKISFKDASNFPPIYIASDGSVLNPDLTVAVPAPHDASGGLSGGPATTVTEKDVPANVLTVLHEHTPDAEIASISKQTWGDHVVYLFSFVDQERYPKLAVSAEGMVMHPAR